MKNKHYNFSEITKTKLPLPFLKFEQVKRSDKREKFISKKITSKLLMTNQLIVHNLYKPISKIL